MEYKIALQTDVGIQKKTNQDSCSLQTALTPQGTVLLAVVCDGMGGLSKGEVASAALIKTFCRWFETEMPQILAAEEPLEETRCRWNRILQEQNSKIAAYGKAQGLQIGSTITAMLILQDGQYLICHVGDCRVYLVTDTGMTLLTEDQTVVGREVRQGRLTPAEAENDPRRNVLLQCVGASRFVDPQFYRGAAAADTGYLLCSDGFRHVISSEEMLTHLAPKNNPDENAMNRHICELIALNKRRQENDNITALFIQTTQER